MFVLSYISYNVELQNSVSAVEIHKGHVRGVLDLSEEINPLQLSDGG